MLDLTDRKNIFYWQTDRNLTSEDYDRIFLKRHEISASDITSVLQQGITSILGTKDIVIENPDENVTKGNVNIVRKIVINGKPFVVRMHPKGVQNGYFYRLRYTISKMALRIKRFQVDQSESIKEKLEVGKRALIEESNYFKI